MRLPNKPPRRLHAAVVCRQARLIKLPRARSFSGPRTLKPPPPCSHKERSNESRCQGPACAPESGLEISRPIRCQGLQTLQQRRDGHNDSPDHKRPRPGETEKQCDSKIANEVVELPTELGTGGPFGRAEGGDHQQDH